MADLTEIQSAQSVKIIGSDASGVETNPLNVNSNGQLEVITTSAAVGTATPSNVTASASSTQLLDSNTSRKGVIIHNDSSAYLLVHFGATASSTAFTVKIPSDCNWSMPLPIYTGVINGIWEKAAGAARIVELT